MRTIISRVAGQWQRFTDRRSFQSAQSSFCLQMTGAEAPRLVRTIISRLAGEGEEDWVSWVCCELAVQVRRVTTIESQAVNSDDFGWIGRAASWQCRRANPQLPRCCHALRSDSEES